MIEEKVCQLSDGTSAEQNGYPLFEKFGVVSLRISFSRHIIRPLFASPAN